MRAWDLPPAGRDARARSARCWARRGSDSCSPRRLVAGRAPPAARGLARCRRSCGLLARDSLPGEPVPVRGVRRRGGRDRASRQAGAPAWRRRRSTGAWRSLLGGLVEFPTPERLAARSGRRAAAPPLARAGAVSQRRLRRRPPGGRSIGRGRAWLATAARDAGLGLDVTARAIPGTPSARELDDAWALVPRQRARRARRLHRHEPGVSAAGRAAREPGRVRQRRGRARRSACTTSARRRAARDAPSRRPTATAPAPSVWLAQPAGRAHATCCSSRRSTPVVAPQRSPPTATASRSSAPGPTPTPTRSTSATPRPARGSTGWRRDETGRGARTHELRAGRAAAVRGRPLPRPDGRDRPLLQPAARRDRPARTTPCRAPTCSRSPTPTRATSNLAWLFQIVLALAHRAGGIAGTVLLKTAFVLATLAVLFRVALRRGAHPAAAAAALALAAWAAEPRFVERPHLVHVPRPRADAAGARARRGAAGRARSTRSFRCGLVWANANSCFFLAPARARALRRSAPRSTDAAPTPGARRSSPLRARAAHLRDAVGRGCARLHRQPLADALAAAAAGVPARALARSTARSSSSRPACCWRGAPPGRRWRHLLPVGGARAPRRAPHPLRRRVRARWPGRSSPARSTDSRAPRRQTARATGARRRPRRHASPSSAALAGAALVPRLVGRAPRRAACRPRPRARPGPDDRDRFVDEQRPRATGCTTTWRSART